MAATPLAFAELSRQVEAEAARLDRELAEIDLLVQQARIEATRHEQKRAQMAERLDGSEAIRDARGAAGEQFSQLLTLTKRASLMEAQLDILEGKQKALTRYRDTMREVSENLERVALHGPAELLDGDGDGAGQLPPALSRAVLGAQEDLRRDIARQMHDGPAQSLTNIVLRAQIVQRLMRHDPERAEAEVGQLVEMVQQTLDATKSFIFDVRPMVLDDLGLVPTLRRAARDRGHRARVPIEFESVGADRRLAPDVESGLFRILDDAATGFLATRPSRISIRLDWTDDEVCARVSAERADEPRVASSPDAEQLTRDEELTAREANELPPVLAAMIREEQADADAASAAAASAFAAARSLPPGVWNEIRQRAATIGAEVSVSADGQTLQTTLDLNG